MWIRELESIYSENLINEYYTGLSVDSTPHTKNVAYPVQDKKNSLNVQGMIGIDQGNPYNIAQANGSNTPVFDEQEEEPISNDISSHIEDAMSKLDPSSQQHAHTYLTLKKLNDTVKQIGLYHSTKMN